MCLGPQMLAGRAGPYTIPNKHSPLCRNVFLFKECQNPPPAPKIRFASRKGRYFLLRPFFPKPSIAITFSSRPECARPSTLSPVSWNSWNKRMFCQHLLIRLWLLTTLRWMVGVPCEGRGRKHHTRCRPHRGPPSAVPGASRGALLHYTNFMESPIFVVISASTLYSQHMPSGRSSQMRPSEWVPSSLFSPIHNQLVTTATVTLSILLLFTLFTPHLRLVSRKPAALFVIW